jgi:zinc protease
MLKHGLLPNGIEVLVKEKPLCNLVAIQCWVNVGSLDEQPDERGMSHLIEHMLFKGTAKRKVGEIASTVEACGGDVNAYTTFDRTVFYLTLTSNHLETGLDLLSDAIFNSAFDAEELEKEKEVVVEEIRRSLDNPGSMVGRKLFEQCFKGSEAGRPIIGYEEEVKAFGRKNILNFHSKWYQPKNLSVVVVGDFKANIAMDLVEKYFGVQTDNFSTKRHGPKIEFPKGITVHLIKGDYELPRLELAFRGPSLEDHDTVALDATAFALGAGDSSRFSRRLRDEKGLVSGIGASLYSPNFAGIFSLSAYPIVDHYVSTLEEMIYETMRLKYQDPVTVEELNRTRQNLKSDKLYQEETVGGEARSIGHGLTTQHKHLFEEHYLLQMEKLTVPQIQHAVDAWLDERNVVIIGMVPKHVAVTEDDLKQAYLRGMGRVKPRKLPSAADVKSEKESLVERRKVHSQMNLVYRHDPSANFLSLTAVAPGGLRLESEVQAGVFNASTSLLAKASKKYSYEQMLEITEGLGANLGGFSGKDSFGIKLHCLNEQVDKLLPVFVDSFLNPIFPEEQWRNLKREIEEEIKSEEDSSANVCMRKFQELLYGNHPYRHPLYGTRESFKTFNDTNLCEFFNQVRDRSQWIVAGVGPFDVDEITSMLSEALSSWKHTTPPAEPAQPFKANSVTAEAKHIPKDREQTHIVIGYPGYTWGDPRRAGLEIMSTVLGGQGGRLFLRLRDQQSLAYTVSPLLNFGVDPGIFGAYIACAPDKRQKALQSLNGEFDLLKKELVSEGELNRAKNYIIGSNAVDLQHGDAMATTMALMELYGLGADDFVRYRKNVEKISSQDLKKLANEIFDPKREISVSVGAVEEL